MVGAVLPGYLLWGQQPCSMVLSIPHTVNSLGISEELKEKLRDVMVDRHKVALGKTLGEGEAPSLPMHPPTSIFAYT